tara:strand:+ start:5427 stop:6410 length:984 start_codon:yes stop_codon:yes gene_type:complete
MKLFLRLSLITAGFTLIFIIVFISWFWICYNAVVTINPKKRVIIDRGMGIASISIKLADAGVINNPLVFRIGAQFDGLSKKLRAGEFHFAAGLSAREVAQHIAAGQIVQRRLTIPEGLSSVQIIDMVNNATGLVGTIRLKSIAEGSLFPDTYFYVWGDSRKALILRMEKLMKKAVAEQWKNLSPKSILKTKEELQILASIIEKETGVNAERARISAVFQNRLRRGMRLQSDPTVVYALTRGKRRLNRRLTYADLRKNSPYNTYLHHGLPPAPIASPGYDSLRAAAQPLVSKELYFVADGMGGHAFARTLKDHNRNVAKWRRKRGKVN